MPATPMDDPKGAALAVTRFGLGARTSEIEAASADPKGWLLGQIRRSGAPQPKGLLDTSEDQIGDLRASRAAQNEAREARLSAPAPTSDDSVDPRVQAAYDARRRARRDIVGETGDEFLARTVLGSETPDGFAERWALFWANGFTVSATKANSLPFLGQFEREAIRPHVFGRFDDLAVAAEQHPAMLFYLDQVQSTGPNSQAGTRRGSGLNENLAREIMELHTVGADGGYGQADVTEFARALTGWSVERGDAPAARPTSTAARPGFVFRNALHEPGERVVMGRTYAATGLGQGEAILRDLANRPETRRRLSRRLAVHFVSDTPPESLVGRLEQAWTDSDGRLDVVARTLVEAPEAWEPSPGKIKTPYEFIVSTHRALGTVPGQVRPLRNALLLMGQPLYAPPSPEGWPDTAADWAGPDAIVKRLNWAKTVGDGAEIGDPDRMAREALGDRLSARTAQAVARAESRAEAVTLFLMSPEFQRR